MKITKKDDICSNDDDNDNDNDKVIMIMIIIMTITTTTITMTVTMTMAITTIDLGVDLTVVRHQDYNSTSADIFEWMIRGETFNNI